jgi:tRNA U54 and U55 pseudouridine synthase Pus10
MQKNVDIMNKEEVLDKIFNKSELYKNKYKLIWCDLCSTVAISCPDCEGTSCNCMSCEKCFDDFTEFLELKTTILDYMPEEEFKIYEKGESLKYLMIRSFNLGDKEINWKHLIENGILTPYEEKLFEKEIAEQKVSI